MHTAKWAEMEGQAAHMRGQHEERHRSWIGPGMLQGRRGGGREGRKKRVLE